MWLSFRALQSIRNFFSYISKSIHAEVDTALSTTTITQPGQATPPANATLATAVAYLYKAWRNHSDQTASLYQLYNDDATTVDQKRTVSDDATTADRTEMITGP